MKADTIYAPSTGSMRAGVAVIRVSGPAAGAALRALTGRPLPPPRLAMRARLAGPGDGEEVDEGLVLWFPGPASFTGEDVAEFHVHGGRAVIDGILDALAAVAGLSPAEPGAFTRRAFENGKLDLTQAEGLGDLVNAETAAQRRQALAQMQGRLGGVYESWRRRLTESLAHVEAAIDFSDQDLPGGTGGGIAGAAGEIAREITAHLADGHAGERLRDGVEVVIVGPPNSGKSSILNLLAKRDAAIVSSVAGTTRDVVEVRLDLGGYPVTLADTAGLSQGGDEIEAEGVRRALGRAREADLKLVVLDGETWPRVDEATAALLGADSLVVVNKVDLGSPRPPLEVGGCPVAPLSALTGEGMEALMEALEAAVAERCPPQGAVALTRSRHRRALEECASALRRCQKAAAPELAAEDLRLAVRALGQITGRVGVEDILDIIFRDFCIGK